jgi:hypothetical protein
MNELLWRVLGTSPGLLRCVVLLWTEQERLLYF